MAEWVSALLCLQCDLSGLQGGEKEGERERGGDNSGSRQAVVTSQLAGCVNSTSDLYGNRAASSPLLSLPLLSSWQAVGTRGQIFISPPLTGSALVGLTSSGHQPWTEQDRTGQDSLGREDLSGRPRH